MSCNFSMPAQVPFFACFFAFIYDLLCICYVMCLSEFVVTKRVLKFLSKMCCLCILT